MARPLDRNRPLWEMYLVEGLEQRPVRASSPRPTTRWSTGCRAVDIGQVILDVTPEPQRTPPPTPGGPRTRADVGVELRGRRRHRRGPQPAVRRSTRCAPGSATCTQSLPSARPQALGLLAGRRDRGPAARGQPAQRRDRRAAPLRHGVGTASTTSSGSAVPTAAPSTTSSWRWWRAALRAWLMTRGESVTVAHQVRTHGAGQRPRRAATAPAATGWRRSSSTCPWVSRDPIVRLQRISYEMSQLQGERPARGCRRRSSGIAGFAPPTLHSLGARVGSSA